MSYIVIGPNQDNPALQEYLSSLQGKNQSKENITWIGTSTQCAPSGEVDEEDLAVLAKIDVLPDDSIAFEQEIKQLGQYSVIDEQLLSMPELLEASPMMDGEPIMDLMDLDAIVSSSDAVMLNIGQELKEIVTTDKLDLPWPEDSYQGNELAAYQSIVSQLGGRVPKDDKGQSLTPGSLSGVTNKEGLPEKAWESVFNHIKDELAFFYYIKEWYSDVGYVEWFNQNLALNNFIAIDTINTRYLSISKKDKVTMVLNIMFAVVSRGLGFVTGPYAPAAKAAGAILSLGWMIYKETRPHVDDPIKTTVADAKVAITNRLNEMTDQTEHIGRTLKSNWGKLHAFGQLIRSGKLAWPDDTRPLRAAAYRGYQEYGFQILLPHTKYGIARFGIPTWKKHNAYWRPKTGNYFYYTKTVVIGKDWWGNKIHGYFTFMMGTDGFIAPKEAPKKLQRKMFGLSDKDLGDPQLKLYGPDFFWHNPWKLPLFKSI